MKQIFVYLGGIVLIVLIIMVSYGIWNIQKKVNYKLQYETMVKETVKEMVKKECLK